MNKMLVVSKLLPDNIKWHVLYSCTLTVHKNCFANVKTETVKVVVVVWKAINPGSNTNTAGGKVYPCRLLLQAATVPE